MLFKYSGNVWLHIVVEKSDTESETETEEQIWAITEQEF